MAPKVERIVDAHVHLWDPANTEWYPYLSGLRDVGVANLTGWARYFDQKIYFSELANWNVQKFVHVAAASDFVAETLEKEAEAQATGHPDAIVGGVALVEVEEAVDQLDRQMVATHFRGVRPMGGNMERAVPSPDILRALQERNLVFDLMAHPDQLEEAAQDLKGWDDLTVVIEHTGWPHANTDEEFALWKKGMSALAALGPNVNCKLSGLAMPFQTMDPAVFRRWVDHSIELFGVDRCFFGSNFPPDGGGGTLDELFTTFSTLTAELDAADREKLFAANAERVYRC
jgi:predicted TIM-barrel fold metal-dependent hydrolase